MGHETNIKYGIIVNGTQPISGISDTTLVDDHNLVPTSSAVYRALSANTSVILNPSDIVATVTPVGSGIHAGDTVAQGVSPWDFVRQLISPYVPPIFSTFSVNFDLASTLEVGRTATITNATYSVTNDSESTPPNNIYISGIGWNPAIYLSGSPVTTNTTPITVQKTTASSESWVINGSGKYGTTINRSFSKAWQYIHRFGASATVISDGSSAQTVITSLTNNALSSGKARTVTCTTDNADLTKYTYISYDSSYGALTSIIQNGALPVLTAFTRLPDYPYLNSYGVTRTMITYKSNSTGAFANGVTLAIT